MRDIHCQNCQEPLPEKANYCAKCGEHSPVSEHSLSILDENLVAPTIKIVHQPLALKVAHFNTSNNVNAYHAGSHRTATTQRHHRNDQVSVSQTFLATQTQISEHEINDDELQQRANWEKVVTHKTLRVVPLPVTPPAVPVVYKPPVGSTPPALISVRKTPPKKPSRLSVHLFSWASILVLICLLLGGVFGLAVSFGRGFLAQSSQNSNVFALQVTPSIVALDGIVTLHGSGFSPSGRIGLTRDSNITLVDTGFSNIIHADSRGSFSDTVIVDPTWGASSHSLHAEDANTHKSASYTVSVTGQSASLHPSHLLLSTNTIDLGSGDQATNSTQMITLSNAGGGQISWQATATQPWLMVSPKSGTLSYGQTMKVAVAADRSNLKIGGYTASLFFTSNTGPVTLPIKMFVSALQPGHVAVLQLTPPLLSFSGTDGGINPQSQVVTVSNPGVLPLQWSATSTTNDGSSWLAITTRSGTVTKGGSQAVTIGVNTSTMLPGAYNGLLNFSSQGNISAKDSPQTIFVSLVITPQCALQISPGVLTFARAYLQSSPAQKVITIGDSQSCSMPLAWSTTVTTSSGGQWLSIGQTSGVTPSSPTIHVSSTGLKPGNYNGSINFNWPGGTQNLPITLIVGQVTTPNITATSTTMAFSGIIGQTTALTQTATISNTGGGTLVWHARAVTTIGGAWLGITPVSGAINPSLSTPITVTATPLTTLTAGTYTGTITITGTDIQGHPANGSPLSIPVNLVVQAPCSVTATPPALNFQGVVGGANPVAQSATIAASGACVHALNWTATATTSTGGAWLTASPTGTVSVTAPSASSVGVSLKGITSAGTYRGSVTLTTIDSVTKLAVGMPRVIAVTLTLQPVCSLQTPSAAAENFSTEAGFNPATRTFTVGVIGACIGNITITPTIVNSIGWLAPSVPVVVISGGNAPFSVSIKSAGLAAGTYTGSISLVAVNGGIAISGSPQVIPITLNVLATPALAAGPGKVINNVSNGVISQPVIITNSGGSPLNWTAALSTGAPFTLSTASGTNLAGGATTSINVRVDTTGLPGGTTVTTNVVISAIDSLTMKPVAGSPVTLPITITIPPPQMLLSTTSLTFTTTAGTNPTPTSQTINVLNGGGGTLKWTIGVPTQTWLTVSSTTDSDTAGQSAPLTFNVNITGLNMATGTYPASIIITPSVGNPITVSVSLAIN